MRTKRALGLLLACAAMLAWSHATLPPPPKATAADVTVKIFQTAEIQKRVMSAPVVTATRVHSEPRRKNGQGAQPADIIPNYKTDATQRLNQLQMAQVKKLLSSPDSYDFNLAVGCLPDYGVVFTFGEGKDAVKVAFCFHCRQLGVFVNDGNVNGIDNFNPMYPQMAHLCIELFPKDKVLRGLPEAQ